MGSETCRRHLSALLAAVAPLEADEWAAAFIQEFGSLRASLDASPERLAQLTGGNLPVATLLSATREALLHTLREPLMCGPVIGNTDRLLQYLQFAFAHLRTEHVRVLYLDASNGIVRDELMAEGTIQNAVLHPRTILKRALELDAASLILVHNHPSGDARPSQEDRRYTRSLADAAGSLGIILHDHVIVGKGKVSSFRLEGLL